LKKENKNLKDLHSVYSKLDTAASIVEKEKSFKQGRIIAKINEDVEINLEEAQAKLYRIDLEHPGKILSMQDVDDEEPADVEEVLEVVKAADKELASPKQMDLGKDISNPLMVGRLPKTTLPTRLSKIHSKGLTHFTFMNLLLLSSSGGDVYPCQAYDRILVSLAPKSFLMLWHVTSCHLNDKVRDLITVYKETKKELALVTAMEAKLKAKYDDVVLGLDANPIVIGLQEEVKSSKVNLRSLRQIMEDCF
nr:hypothetical protein [Tanacetum cinerariifolium]